MVNRNLGRWMAAGAMAFLVGVGAVALANNFNTYADKNGCESVIPDRERRDCQDLSKAKDETCNKSLGCDLDKQQRTIEKYNEAKKRLDDGSIADADKDRQRQTIRELKDDLDARKAAAHEGIDLADKCVKARVAVQEFFERTAIPLTERLRDDAVRERKDLLDKLDAAQRKVRDTKEKRDKDPNDSSANSDYESAVKALRDVEKQLEDFNNKYGKDIEYNAGRIVQGFKDGKASHQKPIDEATNRRENCKTLDNLSY